MHNGHNTTKSHNSKTYIRNGCILCSSILYRVEQRKRMFFKWLVLVKGGGWWRWAWAGGQLRHIYDLWLRHCSFSSYGALERRASCVSRRAVFFRNSDSVATVQRLFRRKFNVERRGAIPDRNTILRWVEAFRTTGSVTKSWNIPFVKKSQLCRKKKCWSVRCRTLRTGSECVSGKKDVIWLTLFSVRNLVRTLKMH